MLLTMKNIVKVAGPSQLRALFIPSGLARGEISSDPEPPFKTLAGCPFELGVHAIHAIRTIVAEEREWLWTEER